MPTSAVVRLVRKLSIAALKATLDKELALWYCLRAVNHWGSGHLELQGAIDDLMGWFGYSASMAYRTLTDNDGLFLAKRRVKGVNKVQIAIYGVKRVARYSGYPSRRCLIEIPILKSVRYEGQSVIQL